MSNRLALLLEQKVLHNNHETLEQSPSDFHQQCVTKINYYCNWLDSLNIHSVMVFSPPSLDLLCLCYALVLKNKTYIPVHTSTAPELLTSYLTTFAVDVLVIGDELISSFSADFLTQITKEPTSTFFYYQPDTTANKWCWLPGIVFFTSGTTELPKTVHYHYDTLAHYLTWCIHEFNLRANDRFLFTTELSFVASLRPLFLPLLSGATNLFIATQANKINLIVQALRQGQVSVLNITPTVFKIILEHIKQNNAQQELRSIRLILLSGEPLHTHSINYWLHSINPETVFYNLYGATEFIVPFYKRITHPLTEEERLELGELRAGSDYRLISQEGKGYELYIAGDIATGYFDTTKNERSYVWLDKKKFIKTNDFVQVVHGKLHYYTRNHRLIKRYGQIINLNQIEYLLNHLCATNHFVAITNEHNDIHLFIEQEQHDHALLSTIKKILKSHLPSYMHPKEFYFIAEFPRTKSGKIDYLHLKDKAATSNISPLHEFFKKFFPPGALDNHALVMELGLESIDYIELSLLFLQETGNWLDSGQINNATRISDLNSYLVPVNFKNTSPKLSIKVHPFHVSFYLQQKEEIYFVSTWPLHNTIDIKQLELAIANTMKQHFMLSCKIVRIKDEYYYEKTPVQTSFWLKKTGLFIKKSTKPEVFTRSERLVYVYLQKNNNQYFLIIGYHHIALDGWSAQLLREEIFRRYEQKNIAQLSLNEELDLLNKINEVNLPLPQSINTLAKELKPIIVAEYMQMHSLYNGKTVSQNSCILISHEQMQQFIARNHLGDIPFSVLFALVFHQALAQLIGIKKLMFFVSFSNRNLPLLHIKDLMTNLATGLPIFFNSEDKTLLTCAQELQKTFALYFNFMNYSALAALFEQHILDPNIWGSDFFHSYTYINKIITDEYRQNKYLDWSNSKHELYLKKKLTFLRVYNFDTHFAVILNTTLNSGLHEKIINYIKRIFI